MVCIFACEYSCPLMKFQSALTEFQGRLLLAGLYPVEFRDFFLGDMYCSLSYAMAVSPSIFNIFKLQTLTKDDEECRIVLLPLCSPLGQPAPVQLDPFSAFRLLHNCTTDMAFSSVYTALPGYWQHLSTLS